MTIFRIKLWWREGEGAKERERVCMCVCAGERERESERELVCLYTSVNDYSFGVSNCTHSAKV